MRISVRDLVRIAVGGVTARLTRAALSVLGIAIGVATLVAVTGIPASGQQALLEELSRLGTDLLEVTARPAQGDDVATFPAESVAMAERVGPVTGVSAVANTQASVRRSDVAGESSGVGVAVLAARDDLLGVIDGELAHGRYLDAALDRFPTVVLGSEAARWLGLTRLPDAGPAPQVLIGDRWFAVVGILEPARLVPAIDQSALVGWPAAESYLGFDGRPSVLYVTAQEDAIEDVREVLPATVHPELAGLVSVSRPSDALLAKRQTETTFSGLFVGLAGVALLVGGIGVANTMIVSVLERRGEIGLRRSLGATRGHVRAQFLTEAVLLSGAGGLVGVVLGTAGTVGYALWRGWPVVLPPAAVALGLAGAVAVGVVAGLYPAVRAARLPPTEALATA
ncbi:ABC transporter permease [Promicromonospora citrea]|uniref:ABC transporter permease n=1 Tax=Promicromonospora citrea TaxID=43677 RepID=A0A8H9GFD6_9MICO|nr:ABC transporter permease [Promicromonospora citrea]NNH53016.1 ABC transporter permease [Promicromonospora citrea]GGM15549.1 ABC transporter permease [Promicromonospora citrea]